MPAPLTAYAPPASRTHRGRARQIWRRHLRRWGPMWIIGLALLAASQMLWLWQSWPVRDLLSAMGAGR